MSLLEDILKTESLDVKDLIKQKAKRINSQIRKKKTQSIVKEYKPKKEYKPRPKLQKRKEIDEETRDFIDALLGVGTAYVITKLAEYFQ